MARAATLFGPYGVDPGQGAPRGRGGNLIIWSTSTVTVAFVALHKSEERSEHWISSWFVLRIQFIKQCTLTIVHRVNNYQFTTALFCMWPYDYPHCVVLSDWCRGRTLAPTNPILTSKGKPGLTLQKSGHASVVETQTGASKECPLLAILPDVNSISIQI